MDFHTRWIYFLAFINFCALIFFASARKHLAWWIPLVWIILMSLLIIRTEDHGEMEMILAWIKNAFAFTP